MSQSEIKCNEMSAQDPFVIVDMRSDTVTTPTKEMRVAMFEAEVGDDVFEDDPTMNILEKKAASIFEKEKALFVPSGTMGNLICVMVHCARRGDEVLLGDKSHISRFEQGGMASIGGVHPRTVKTCSDGTLDLDDLKAKIMPDDIHAPCTRLVCIENTHNLTGGRVLQPTYVKSLVKLIKVYNLKLHVDGARIFNAATALGVSVASLVEDADSVSVCLSKGLGAPVGSIILGDTEFISKARRLRKALGGGMRQVGILAAPGLIALEKMSLNLQVDHDNAKQLALGLFAIKNLGVQIEPDTVETNIVYFDLNHPNLTGKEFVEKLATVNNGGVVVKVVLMGPSTIRAVLHHQVSSKAVELCLQKIQFVLKND